MLGSFVGALVEFEQEDASSFKRLIVHFDSQADLDAFAALVQQNINIKTVSIWYPKKDSLNLKEFIAK